MVSLMIYLLYALPWAGWGKASWGKGGAPATLENKCTRVRSVKVIYLEEYGIRPLMEIGRGCRTRTIYYDAVMIALSWWTDQNV